MRILLTVHQFLPNHSYGTEQLTLHTGRELLARGHEVFILTTERMMRDSSVRNPDYSEYVYEGLRVRSLNFLYGTSDDPIRDEYDNRLCARQSGDYIDEVSPDIIHIMHAGRLSGTIFYEANKRNIPLVFTATDFWSVCRTIHLRRVYSGELCSGPDYVGINCLKCYMAQTEVNRAKARQDKNQPIALSGAGSKPLASLPVGRQSREGPSRSRAPRTLASLGKLCRFLDVKQTKQRVRSNLGRFLNRSDTGIRFMIAVSGLRVFRGSRLLRRMRSVIDRTDFLRGAVNLSDVVIAPTALTRDVLIRNGIEANKVRLSHYGMDLSEVKDTFEKSHRVKRGEKVRIGFIGALAPHKGVDVFIKAARSLPHDLPVEILIYGDPQRDTHYYRKLLKLSEGDDRINLLGTFKQNETGQVLANIDVLVVPSRWYENTPLVVYSALAVGVPVVATNLGGLSEIIEHERNGLLFDVGDSRMLGDQLKTLVTNSHLLEQLSSQAKQERDVFDAVDELEGIYTDLTMRCADH